MEKYYIGLACSLHDPAIAIVNSSGGVLFAEAAERHLQSKRGIGCPPDDIAFVSRLIEHHCDPEAAFEIAITWSKAYLSYLKALSVMGWFNQPKKAFEPVVHRITKMAPHDVLWMSKLQLSTINQAGSSLEVYLRSTIGNNKLKDAYYSHHLTHAATACYTSPFQQGVCLIVDGRGEHGSITLYRYRNSKIELIQRQKGTPSLGFLYILITEICRFDPLNGGEGKAMGLASYGSLDSTIYTLLKSIFKVEGCNLRYATSFNKMQRCIAKLYAMKRETNSSPLESANIAYTGQLVFSELMTELLNNIYELSISDNLILGGGCALNSAFNGKILDNTKFKRMHIPCAPGDDGNALGAAWLSCYRDYQDNTLDLGIHRPYLGSSISEVSLGNLRRQSKIKRIRHLPKNVEKAAATELAHGKLVGWVQGRAEFGPRALGNRSILADPRSAKIKDKIDRLVKLREPFRPYAPSILHQHGDEYFEKYQESPYMERTLKFKREVVDRIPAVVHCDGTGRLHTVKREWNNRFYNLIYAFYELTGIPLILNTSFNVMGKPIIQ